MLWVVLLAGFPIFWAAGGLHGGENRAVERAKDERPAQETGISSEDRQVIRKMELLSLMELLKDMEILEGETKTVPEEKK